MSERNEQKAIEVVIKSMGDIADILRKIDAKLDKIVEQGGVKR
ncbi:hypothetical protein [Bacillus sp. AFS017336]|nr:hypothetical protein [Bacillus sp. AFS017336]